MFLLLIKAVALIKNTDFFLFCDILMQCVFYYSNVFLITPVSRDLQKS